VAFSFIPLSFMRFLCDVFYFGFIFTAKPLNLIGFGPKFKKINFAFGQKKG